MNEHPKKAHPINPCEFCGTKTDNCGKLFASTGDQIEDKPRFTLHGCDHCMGVINRFLQAMGGQEFTGGH